MYTVKEQSGAFKGVKSISEKSFEDYEKALEFAEFAVGLNIRAGRDFEILITEQDKIWTTFTGELHK